MRSAHFRFLALLLTAPFAIPALAQSPPSTTSADQMGMQPYQSYHGGNIDSVSLSNGAPSLNIPLLEYPQRGKLHFSFNLFYNNQLQHLSGECASDGTCDSAWKVFDTDYTGLLPVERSDVFVGSAQYVQLVGIDSAQVTSPGTSSQTSKWYSKFSLQMADGSKHLLGNLGTATQTGPFSGPYPNFQSYNERYSGPWETLDATGWRVNGGPYTSGGSSADYLLAPPTAIIGPDGVSYNTGTAFEEDPNGNKITISNGGYLDSLGRQIPAPPGPSTPSNTDTSGCPQPPATLLAVDHAVLWTVPAPGGSTASYKFCYAKVFVNPAPAPTIGPYVDTTAYIPGYQTKLQSVVLPNGQTWSFQYNDPGDGSIYLGHPVNYGTLTTVTLPTGGTISYTYTTTGALSKTFQNAGRFVATKTVNANDGTGMHTWTYAYTISNTLGTTSAQVTDPLRNYVVHTLGSGCLAGYDTQTQFYQNGGTLLKTINTTYSVTQTAGIYPQPGPCTNMVPTQITTTWPNGQTASTTKS